MRLILALILTFALTACAQFPELDDAVSAHGAETSYPDLVPIEGILAAAIPAEPPEQTTGSVNARVAALRARANRLRGGVVDPTTRQRMRTGVPTR